MKKSIMSVVCIILGVYTIWSIYDHIDKFNWLGADIALIWIVLFAGLLVMYGVIKLIE